MSVAIPPSPGVSAATGTGACACVRADAGAQTWPLLARSGLPARVPEPPGGILVALEQRDPIAPLRFKQPLQVLARARRRLPAQRCLRHGSLRQAPGRAYTNDARRAGAEAAARRAQRTLTTSRMTPTTRCAAAASASGRTILADGQFGKMFDGHDSWHLTLRPDSSVPSLPATRGKRPRHGGAPARRIGCGLLAPRVA